MFALYKKYSNHVFSDIIFCQRNQFRTSTFFFEKLINTFAGRSNGTIMNYQLTFSKPSSVTVLLLTFTLIHATRSFIPVTKISITSQAYYNANGPALPSTKPSKIIDMMRSQPQSPDNNYRTILLLGKKENDDLEVLSSVENMSSALSSIMKKSKLSLIYLCCVLISFLTVPFFTAIIFNILFLSFSLFGQKALEIGDENFNDDTEKESNSFTNIISFVGATFTTFLIAPPTPLYTYTTSSIRTIESKSNSYTSSIVTYQSSSIYQSNDISAFPVVLTIATICFLILSMSKIQPNHNTIINNDLQERNDTNNEESESDSTILLEVWDQKMKNYGKSKNGMDEKEK